MCGIAGLWFSKGGGAQLEAKARAMGGTLRHRGPDAEGTWCDPARGLALAHLRLSILDLSEAGSQPMLSHCDRYVMVYNGECYNFRELRDQLLSEGCVFRGGSDTEVILEGCARWGVRRTLERLNGMFAFALWDRRNGELVLARDRLGIKPLYYGWSPGVFWFGSELRALREVPEFERRLDTDSLGLFFKHGYVPAPSSIFQGVFKLPSAHFLVLKSASDPTSLQCYWPLVRDFEKGQIPAFPGTLQEAQEQLDGLLRKSVSSQMVSDVPLGAFLSGGIDSSTVVALMQDQSSRPIKTFTIGFEEDCFNEADSSRAVARHLQTEHTDLVLTSGEAQAIVPMLGDMFDEPFADASQIPTYAVSRLARRHVTVSLSGDGGDELFLGYRHYGASSLRLKRLNQVPRFARRFISSGVQALSEQGWDHILNFIPKTSTLSGFKLHKYAALLQHDDPLIGYDLMNARWFAPEGVVCGLAGNSSDRPEPPSKARRDLTELIAAADLNQYLPEDILTKLDRASMAVSLESRVPLLDHDVVTFALSLPLSFKRANGDGKIILRQMLDKYVPRKLVERPKQGFSVPVSAWIRGPLRDWAENLFQKACERRSGILDGNAIRHKWQEHLSARRDWGELLWPVLMFESWAERWL